MTVAPKILESALEHLGRTLLAEDPLAREFAASRSQFFRVAPRPDDRTAQRRHLEWFLLERPSEALDGLPVERARELFSETFSSPDEPHVDLIHGALRASFCGVFEVTGTTPGEGAWVRDLSGVGEYAVADEQASLVLEKGDLLVGRLFPVGDSLHRISSAAGFFRNRELLEAVQRDVEQQRGTRRGVLRWSQADLESMFWGTLEAVEGREAIERARDVLAAGGLPRGEVEQILSVLQSTPFDPEPLMHGGPDTFGMLLDRIAFESEVDLEAARQALLEAWPALARERSPRSSTPAELSGKPALSRPVRSTGKVDVRTAIEAFDRGRGEGRDLESLFQELERDLDLEQEPSEEDDPERLAPDFPGVVGAMVEEYLWETAHEHGKERAQRHSGLRRLSKFGERLGVFENVGARELSAFAAVWLPERGELESAEQTSLVLEALRSFCDWATERHDVSLSEAYRVAVEPLAEALPRIVEANQYRSRRLDPSAGESFEFLSSEGGLALLRDPSGAEARVHLDERVSRRLRPGDRVRAKLEAGAVALVACCYPAPPGSPK